MGEYLNIAWNVVYEQSYFHSHLIYVRILRLHSYIQYIHSVYSLFCVQALQNKAQPLQERCSVECPVL